MNRPLSVEPKSGFRLQLVYPDGIEGMIDLSPDVGRGVFAPLADEAFFRTVRLRLESGKCLSLAFPDP